MTVWSGSMGIYTYAWDRTRTVRYTHTVRNLSEIRIKNNQPCHQIVNVFEASPMIQVRLEYIVKSANVKSLSGENGHILMEAMEMSSQWYKSQLYMYLSAN